jgi:O-antigen/teichoic acid export membrane protein
MTPSLDTYAYVLLAMAGISALTWIWLFQRQFRSRPRTSGRLLHIIWQSVSKFTLWDHVNRLCIDTLFGIDMAILALLGRMEDLASYSIALRLTSLMMLVPRQMMNGLQLVLSRHQAPRTRSLFAGSYLKVNLLLCLLQFAALVVLAPWLIRVLFGSGIDAGSVTRFSLVIGLAVTILGIGLPLMGVVGALGSVRDATVRVFIPSLALGILAYVVAGASAGAIGMAWANLFAYSLLSGGLILVVLGEQFVQPAQRWVSPIERRWLRQLMNRVRL